MTSHVRLDDVTVLVLFVGISRLVADAGGEGKLGDAVKSIGGYDGLMYICLL